jgi:hypothetical protein
MKELFFGGHSLWFTVPALVGTGFFLLRMILMLLGGVADLDMDGDVDVDVDAADMDHADSTDAFKFLSIQSILAFAMGFGWTGLGMYRGSGVDNLSFELLGATGGGVAMVWLLGLLLKAVMDLQSSGNISIQSTLGLEGSVYATVPQKTGGRGQIKLVVHGSQRMYWAVTEGEEPIPTGGRVKVTRVNTDNTVTVTAV